MSHFAVPVGDELSQIGEQTGQKVDSAMVSRGMRTAKDKNGERLFNSNEFLTSRQVASFFTGLPSSVCVVGCAFVMAVLVYQISKTKTEI